MRNFLLLLAPLFLASSYLLANEDAGAKIRAIETKNLVVDVMNKLQEQGEFANADENTLQLTEQLVQSIVSNPEILDNFANGTLILDEQFVADYLFKDILNTVTSAVTGSVSSIKDFVAKNLRAVAGAIASVASKTLNYITSSKIIMETIKAGIKIAAILLPLAASAGATALAGALFGPAALPIGLAVLTTTASLAATVFTEIATPDRVVTGLKLATVGANLMNTILNKPTSANEAPLLSALEKKHSSNAAKAPKKQVGEAVLLSLKIGQAVEQYLDKIGDKGWNKLNKEQKTAFTNMINSKNQLTSYINLSNL